jgi:hypothetical protein
MPFAVKDPLQHKRNDRQIREIHEKEYLKYLTNLREEQQQQNAYYLNKYYLSSNHINEIERSRTRSAVAKQHLYDRINRENSVLYDRLLKASKRTLVDDRNRSYEQNLDSFNSKRYQQRSNEYKHIYNDNQVILQRINNAQGHLMTRKQCDNDWKHHISVMKKSCDYPENIDSFVSKMNINQQKQACRYSTMRSEQWNPRHSIIKPCIRLKTRPFSMLLNEF